MPIQLEAGRDMTKGGAMRRGTTVKGLVAVAMWLWPALVRAEGIDWQQASDEALQRLQAYVRVDTTNPPGHETPAVELLQGWLTAEGIEARLYDPMGDPQRQALVARLPGSSGTTDGRTLVLMSHSDVVPAVAS